MNRYIDYLFWGLLRHECSEPKGFSAGSSVKRSLSRRFCPHCLWKPRYSRKEKFATVFPMLVSQGIRQWVPFLAILVTLLSRCTCSPSVLLFKSYVLISLQNKLYLHLIITPFECLETFLIIAMFWSGKTFHSFRGIMVSLSTQCPREKEKLACEIRGS